MSNYSVYHWWANSSIELLIFTFKYLSLEYNIIFQESRFIFECGSSYIQFVSVRRQSFGVQFLCIARASLVRDLLLLPWGGGGGGRVGTCHLTDQNETQTSRFMTEKTDPKI